VFGRQMVGRDEAAEFAVLQCNAKRTCPQGRASSYRSQSQSNGPCGIATAGCRLKSDETMRRCIVGEVNRGLCPRFPGALTPKLWPALLHGSRQSAHRCIIVRKTARNENQMRPCYVRLRPDRSHHACLNDRRTPFKGDFHVHRRRHSWNNSDHRSYRVACSQGLENSAAE